jgi:hypothetical protein
MQEREKLAQKGYDVTTKDLGLGWLCVLEWHGQIQNFHGITEPETIRRAAAYVERLEQGYRKQQMRLACEECSE